MKAETENLHISLQIENLSLLVFFLTCFFRCCISLSSELLSRQCFAQISVFGCCEIENGPARASHFHKSLIEVNLISAICKNYGRFKRKCKPQNGVGGTWTQLQFNSKKIETVAKPKKKGGRNLSIGNDLQKQTTRKLKHLKFAKSKDIGSSFEPDFSTKICSICCKNYEIIKQFDYFNNYFIIINKIKRLFEIVKELKKECFFEENFYHN